jgi:hypothetical protein
MSDIDWHAWGAFLAEIQKAERQLKCQPYSERFYRGHADGAWPLLPTLLRRYTTEEDVREAESSLFFEFQARARELHHLQLTDWDVLFFMRHHGVPTRLLDWTETLGIALYFALENYRSDATRAEKHTPCVWVMNPFLLNGHGKGEEDLFTPRNLGWEEDEDTYYDYGEILVDPDWIDWEEPLAIYPQQKPARMGAQRGWFTIHGSDVAAIEEQCDYAVRKVAIPEEVVPAALEVLRIGGIDPYGIYADLDGLAASLLLKNPSTAELQSTVAPRRRRAERK